MATGLFGLGEERNGATDLGEVRAEKMDSRIDVFGKAFLGLTIACARCHDHKFDPIPTADYYSLGGIFESTQVAAAARSNRLQKNHGKPKRSSGGWRRRTTSDCRHPKCGQPGQDRGDIVFDDFAKPSFEGWHVNGLAFAAGPIGGMANSFRGGSDKLMGTLMSRSFRPTKQYIHVRLAGTKFSPVREHPSLLAVTIFANGRYPKGVAGDGDGILRWKTITLHEEIGQVCNLEIADRRTDGHIIVDKIVFSDSKEPPSSRRSDRMPDLVEISAAYQHLSVQAPSTPSASLAPRSCRESGDAGCSRTISRKSTRSRGALPGAFRMLAAEDEPHNLRIHVRGNHLNPGDEVPRGFLQVLAGDQAATLHERQRTPGTGRSAVQPG